MLGYTSSEMTNIEKIRKIADEHQAAKVDGVLVDGFTASAVINVHDQLSPVNRAKFAALPLAKLVAVTWKLIG